MDDCTDEEQHLLRELLSAVLLVEAGDTQIAMDLVRSLVPTGEHQRASISQACVRMAAFIIQRAIQGDYPLDCVLLLLECTPQCCQYRFGNDGNNGTLLHVACNSDGASLELVRAIFNHYPEAIQIRVMHIDNTDLLPLDIACFKGANMEVVQFLVDAYPESVMIANNRGMIPLHSACMCDRPSLDVMRLLINRYRSLSDDGQGGGAIADNVVGGIPLHFAASNPSCGDTLRLLLQTYPQGIKTTDHNGCLPLHQACLSATDENAQQVLENVRLLVEADPSTIIQRTTDDYREMPLQSAYSHCGRGEIVDYLNERQTQFVAGLRSDFDASIAPLLSSLNDDTKEHIWKFIKPDLWELPEEE